MKTMANEITPILSKPVNADGEQGKKCAVISFVKDFFKCMANAAKFERDLYKIHSKSIKR